jgi:hypothetical protein
MAEEKTRLSKSKPGYGYKYTELAQINELLEQKGESYYQYIETAENGRDYIMTVKVDKDGKESKPLRGCRIVEEGSLKGNNNPAQQMGSAITYARRYSLFMAYGLATEDDDAASLSQDNKSKNQTKQTSNKPKMITADDENYIMAIVNKYPKSNLMSQIQNKYKVKTLKEMTEEQSKSCVQLLNAFDSQQHPTEGGTE